MAKPVGLSPELFLQDQASANFCLQRVRWYVFLALWAKLCLSQRLNSAVTVRKKPRTLCNRICEAGFKNFISNQVVGQICPTNHSLPSFVLDCSTTDLLMAPDFDAAYVQTISEKYRHSGETANSLAWLSRNFWNMAQPPMYINFLLVPILSLTHTHMHMHTLTLSSMHLPFACCSLAYL